MTKLHFKSCKPYQHNVTVQDPFQPENLPLNFEKYNSKKYISQNSKWRNTFKASNYSLTRKTNEKLWVISCYDRFYLWSQWKFQKSDINRRTCHREPGPKVQWKRRAKSFQLGRCSVGPGTRIRNEIGTQPPRALSISNCKTITKLFSLLMAHKISNTDRKCKIFARNSGTTQLLDRGKMYQSLDGRKIQLENPLNSEKYGKWAKYFIMLFGLKLVNL